MDHQSSPADPSAEPALWLVRHGESTWNVAGLAQGHNDLAELTDRGLTQASDAAWQFRDRPIRAIYASDLRRARQTADAFAAVLGLPVIADARLRERSLGAFEGLPSTMIGESVTGLAAGRVADPDVRPVGGESVRDLYRRAARFIDELAVTVDDDAAGDVVVVAHGGTVRVLEAYLCGIPADQMGWGPVQNATVVRIPDFRAGLRGYPRPRAVSPVPQHLLSHPTTRTVPPPSRRQPMIETALTLPQRATKPRSAGLTMVIDGGVPLGLFTDQIELGAEYIDYVKFGWGTSIVTNCLRQKIDVLAHHGIGFYFGGTLFEKFALQGRFEDFRRLCLDYGATHVEASNGTIDMSNAEKAGYIRKLAHDFEVVSEVGFKDSGKSEMQPPSEWIAAIAEDLDAGASLVTLEARESGSSGICRPDGELRYGLLEDILHGGVSVDKLLIEAPNTELQAHLITRIGPDVNLGNIPAAGVIGLETLRLGLRSDTLTAFEGR
jgi:phosphosulfolactate synthase